MNEVLEQMKTRRCIRKFKPDMIPDDILNQILEAGTYAASGMNRQSAVIVAVTDKKLRDRLSKANAGIGGWKETFDPFYGAPVIFIVLADKDCGTGVYDGSLVMGNLMLAAHSLGIGSCWIHRVKQEFEMQEWKDWLASLGIKGNYEGIAHCALGYVDGEYPKAPARKGNRIFYAK